MTAPSFTIARGLGPLPRMLEAARGTPAIARVFNAEGVPVDIAQDQNRKLPLRSLMAVIERAASELGDEFFGIGLGNAMRPEDYGPAVKYMLAAGDVRTLLRRSMRAVGYQQSGTEFSVSVSIGSVWWGYRVVEAIEVGRRHHADHVLKPMLAGLRRYLGNAWAPLRIEVEYDRPRRWRELEEAFGAPVVFGAPTNAVVFASGLLDRPALVPIPPKQVITLRDLRQVADEQPPRNQVDATREIVRLRLMDCAVDIDGAARLFGIGARTLQRRLAHENRTYRYLVEQTRMERALDLIGESSHSITSIALSLGYSDIASFTRAFQRWTGFSPSYYRREPELSRGY